MGIYIGYIEEKGYEPSVYYNFKPLCQLLENELITLSSEDRRALLPESEKENINFSYNYNHADQREFMSEHFSTEQLVAFEFTSTDLQDNLTRGERNPTGYKVIAADMWNSGKIKYLRDFGISLLLTKDNVEGNFYTENVVEISASGLYDGAEVIIELENNFIAGPYVVGFRELDRIYYVRPQIKENKYSIFGYQKSDCSFHRLESADVHWAQDYYSWTLARPLEGALIQYKDVIEDAELLNSFKESISSDFINNGNFNIADVDSLLQHFEASSLTGSPLPKEIRDNRLKRVIEIITAERDLNNTFNFIAETFCDSLSELIIKYKDSPNVDELIRLIFERRPDLIERIQNSRFIKEQIAKLQGELEQVQHEKDQAEENLLTIKSSSESAEKTAVELKTKEISDLDSQLEQKKAQFDLIVNRLSMADSIESMQSIKDSLKQEIVDIEIHKRFLDEGTQRVETAFSTIINNHHDRMVNIAFDGFMSSRMLSAAAQWEAEETEQNYLKAVEIINAIEIKEKNPRELSDYLCQIIKIARPHYTNNDILNIAICMAQSFLTVFSGEPGCGKTSMCNLMAEVLGLNKFDSYANAPMSSPHSLSRYVPVSVERGWTTKRDLVGYFNPLSKTFDKSNRRIFDSLKIVDLENKKMTSKYPFIILLDEANLSPIEYYWADFMNICDDLNSNSQINLGEEYIFSIPETLHFVATINNDHTTETLSPRLIDRAWIITLPQSPTVSIGTEIPLDSIEIIPWNSIRAAFLPQNGTLSFMSTEVQQIYETKIIPHLKKMHFSISPRIDIAIKKYLVVASERFENEYGNPPAIVALDYAIAQKVLPKIIGNGDDFAKWLEEFRSLCSSNNLIHSASLLKDILNKGQMGYYQFFN